MISQEKTQEIIQKDFEKNGSFLAGVKETSAGLGIGFKRGLSAIAIPVGIYSGLKIMDELFIDNLIKKLREKRTRTESKEYYQKMLIAHPQLKKEKPEVIALYWESLVHFAPDMAKEPLAAGAYITQSIRRKYGEDLGGPPPDVFKGLTDIQSNLNKKDEKAKSTVEKLIGIGKSLNTLNKGLEEE
jgi:hypothetical protein